MKKLLQILLLQAWAMLLALASLVGDAQAQATEIEAFVIHPPVAARFQCSEHALGDPGHVPDALGADCVVVRRDGGPNRNLLSLYSGDGTRNEDWHGWREPLLAPCDGVVLIVSVNPESAIPGAFGPGRSSAMAFGCDVQKNRDAVQVAYIHVREVMVNEGARSKPANLWPGSGTTATPSTPTFTLAPFAVCYSQTTPCHCRSESILQLWHSSPGNDDYRTPVGPYSRRWHGLKTRYTAQEWDVIREAAQEA